MPLLVMLGRVLAEIITIIDSLGKLQSIIQRCSRGLGVLISEFDGAKEVNDLRSLFHGFDGRKVFASF